MRSSTLIAAVATSVAAGPVGTAASNNNKAANLLCGIVKGYITAAREQSAAPAYCASLLSIPVATSTSTTVVTSITVSVATLYTSTTTATTSVQLSCNTPGPVAQPTKRDAEPSPALHGQSAVNEVEIIEKRAKVSVKKPSCLASYGTNQLVTSACKCLSTPASTTTVTSTSTSVSTSSTTTSLVATETARSTTKFEIRISGTHYDGRYMQVGDGFGSGGILSGQDYASGSIFSLAPNGALVAHSSTQNYVGNYPDGTYYATHGSATSTFVSFAASQYKPMDDTLRLSCNIDSNAADGTCGLACVVGSTPPATINNVCPRINYDPPWYLGAAVETSCGDSSLSSSPTGLPFQMFAVTGEQTK